MNINERFITEVIVHVCNGASGAMVYIGLESKRYMLCVMGLMIAILMVSGIAHGDVTECYGAYNEKCTCEYNKRSKQLQIICPTRERSTMAGREITRQLKRKRDRDAGVALLRMNDSLIAVKKRY